MACISFQTRMCNKRYFLPSVVFIATFTIFIFYSIAGRLSTSKYYQSEENEKCWRKYSRVMKESSESGNRDKSQLMPSSFQEIPVGIAPNIPKSFLIEERNFCRKNPHLKVIAYIHSAIKKVEKRLLTRVTWANASSVIGTVFMVGKSKDEEEEKIVRRESKMYGDIVQGNYTDKYHLLVYKALNSLFWVKKNCGNVRWVMHADDDVLIDVFKLVPLLNEYEKDGRRDEFFCHRFNNPQVYRTTKWRLNYEEYECPSFPSYCAGPMWVTSSESILKLLHSVPNVRFLWLDDVYLSGFLAEDSGIKRTTIPLKATKFQKNEIGGIITWFNLNCTNEEKLSIWRYILDYHNRG